MEDITAAHRASSEILEFLSELYNSSNRENDYCQTLLKLFDLYCSTGEFAKAAECLDRAAEVDPYEPGHLKRLEMLKGKVDDSRFKVIASRFSSAAKAPEEPAQAEGPTLGASTLQDLMLQAEILVQYGMRNKAVERLQRIQELFPREEERNEDLQRLYLAAGVTPRYAGSAPLPPAAACRCSGWRPVLRRRWRRLIRQPMFAALPVSRKLRASSITRALRRPCFSTAVKEIGAHWEATRCIAAMGKAGLSPTAMDEFCAEGYQESESCGDLGNLVACLQQAVEGHEPLAIQEAAKAESCRASKKVIADNWVRRRSWPSR